MKILIGNPKKRTVPFSVAPFVNIIIDGLRLTSGEHTNNYNTLSFPKACRISATSRENTKQNPSDSRRVSNPYNAIIIVVYC